MSSHKHHVGRRDRPGRTPAVLRRYRSRRLVAVAREALRNKGLHAVVGSSWTTDAPFRETAAASEFARSQGVLAVEMEAAALYTFARTAGVAVICIAHVTNTMGLAEQDFEKGEADGTADGLRMLEAIVSAWF